MVQQVLAQDVRDDSNIHFRMATVSGEKNQGLFKKFQVLFLELFPWYFTTPC